MMKLSYKILCRSLLVLMFSLSLGISGEAQVNNTLYFMHGVPQSNRVNPAYQPEGNIYIGFPLLAPLRAELSSSSLAWRDVFYQHPTEPDSLITFLYRQDDQVAFLNKLKPFNMVASDLGTSLLSVGFRTSVGFFTLDVTTRSDGNIYFPDDLARLMITGPAEGETFVLDGMGADLMTFNEISAGWSGEIIDNLTIGAKAKVLFGIGNLSTQNSDLTVTTSEDSWNIQSDIRVNTSLPFADVRYNNDGMIEDIVINDDLKNPSFSSVSKYMFNTKNLGFGLDLGAVYRPTDQLSLNLSVVDLAFIRWKEEVDYLGYQMEYEFEGIELNPFGFSDDNTIGDYMDSTFSQLADSLSGFLEMGPGPLYSTRLNTKIYAGASYWITPMINVGILSRTDFRKKYIAESVTASVNFSITRLLNMTFSYSYMNSSFRNAGAGFSFNVGPLNLYMVSDNALNVLLWPELSRSVNIWVGLNLIFGYKDRVDNPLVN